MSSSPEPRYSKFDPIPLLILLFVFIGLMIFGIFGSGLILPVGGDIDRDRISKNIQRWTKGCANGGENPKGFGYSEFPDAYRVWYEVDISSAEMECMNNKKVVTLLLKKEISISVGSKSRMGKPPEWFKPKAVIARFDKRSYLLSMVDGKNRYFMTSGEND